MRATNAARPSRDRSLSSRGDIAGSPSQTRIAGGGVAGASRSGEASLIGRAMTLPIVVADTSVLINVLKIDRLDLVGRYPGRLLATDHVESKLADDYPEQKARYQSAVIAGLLDTCSVTDAAEVGRFLRLGPGVPLSAGECSAIAVACLAAMRSQSTTTRDQNRSPRGRTCRNEATRVADSRHHGCSDPRIGADRARSRLREG